MYASLMVGVVKTGVVSVLFVNVWGSVVPTTTPDGIAFWEAAPSILPEASETTKLDAAIPDSVLESALIVLFVSVCVLVAVRTLDGVMIADKVVMCYSGLVGH